MSTANLASVLAALSALATSLSNSINPTSSVPPQVIAAQVAQVASALPTTNGTIIHVGPTRQFTSPALAVAAAKDGDEIDIDAGTYPNQILCINVPNLTIRGVGGKAVLPHGVAGVPTVASLANAWCANKGIIVTNNQVVGAPQSKLLIDNLELSDAKGIYSSNEAGVRAQGTDLIVRNCYFHDNQNGILAGTNTAASMDIQNSEFNHNGAGDGQTHNLYIGNYGTFIFKGNYTHNANVGHEFKTRSINTYVIGNRITDEGGNASYDLDINGGRTYIIGNMIEKGANASNYGTVLNYYNNSQVGPTNGPHELYVINNTFVNHNPKLTVTVRLRNGVGQSINASVINNLFIGGGTDVLQTNDDGTPPPPPDARNNMDLPITTTDLVNIPGFDYHLTNTAKGINAGIDPGSANGVNLTPSLEYVHPLATTARSQSGPFIDMGAYEFYGTPVVLVQPPTVSLKAIPSITDTSEDLVWSTNGASCTASGAWSGSKPVSGTINTGPLTGPQTYTLTCTNLGGNTVASVTAVPPGAPTLVFAAAPKTSVPSGTGVLLTWTANNASSCTASGGWSGTQATDGGSETGPLTNPTNTYTLSCTGLSGGSVSKTVTVTTTAAIPSTRGAVSLDASAEPSEIASSANNTSYNSKTGPTGTLVVKGAGLVNLVPTPTGQGIYFGPGGQQNSSSAFIQFPQSAGQTLFDVNGGEIDANVVSRWDMLYRGQIKAQNNTHRIQEILSALDGTNAVVRLNYDLWGGIEITGQAPGSPTALGVFLPKGYEDAVMGQGKPFTLRLVWDGSTQYLYANSILLGQQAYTKTPITWGAGSMTLIGGGVSATWGPAWTPLVEPLDDLKIFRSTGGGTTGSSDVVAPTTAITAPTSGTSVFATTTVAANASDNIGVTRVDFYRDGAFASTDSAAPYSWSWGTTGVANGTHTLQTKAYDAAGNIGTSASVSVTVSNLGTPPPPQTDTAAPTVSIASPAVGAVVSATVSVNANASDNVGVSRVELYRDGVLVATDATAPYSFNWDTVGATNGAHILQAKAYDAVGNTGSSAQISVTVSNTVGTVSDTTAPTVSLTAPVGGTTVSGTINLSATASDAVGVKRVEFYNDGTLVSTVSATPFTATWNTTSITSGTHTLQAKAYDAAGNVGISSQVSITVHNESITVDTIAPTISISEPAYGATVSGSISIVASASDNKGVTKVEFYKDGILTYTSTAAPFKWTWNTADSFDGTHTLRATAYDAANNPGQASPVTVTVNHASVVSPSPTGGDTVVVTPPTNTGGDTIGSTGGTVTPPVLTRELRIGSTGEDVRSLQQYLNALGFAVTAQGGESTYYGTATAGAVARFQNAHAAEILTPNGLTSGTGVVGRATIAFITGNSYVPSTTNTSSGGGSTSVATGRTVKYGFSGTDIVRIQSELIQKGYLTDGSNSGYFGSLTRAAVRSFQCDRGLVCSGDEVSTGWGLVGPRTQTALAQ